MVEGRVRVLVAGAEDRATLESDLSADVGAYTDGQGVSLCPLLCPSGMRESDKLILGLKNWWSFGRRSRLPSGRILASWFDS